MAIISRGRFVEVSLGTQANTFVHTQSRTPGTMDCTIHTFLAGLNSLENNDAA
jgi:hypothetical protein